MLIDVLLDGLRAALSPQAAALALAAIGLNIQFGYTGLINFGQAGFMLVGAYGLAITVTTFGGSFWLGIAVGLLFAVLFALLLGIPTLRLRADYLAICTVAAGEIMRMLVASTELSPITGGSNGLQRFADEFYRLNPIAAGTYGFGVFRFSAATLWVMLVGWALALLAVLICALLIRSPWGRLVLAIRTDELAATSLGKNTYYRKMQSLVLGGVLGALGGMVLVLSQQSATPESFTPEITFYAFTALILGGVARVWGPVRGAIVFWFIIAALESLLRGLVSSGVLPTGLLAGPQIGVIRFILVGAGLCLLVIFRPSGIFNRKGSASVIS